MTAIKKKGIIKTWTLDDEKKTYNKQTGETFLSAHAGTSGVQTPPFFLSFKPMKCYKVSDIAERLHVSERTIERKISEGKLRSYKGASKKDGQIILEPDLAVYLYSIAHENEKAQEWITKILSNVREEKDANV